MVTTVKVTEKGATEGITMFPMHVRFSPTALPSQDALAQVFGGQCTEKFAGVHPAGFSAAVSEAKATGRGSPTDFPFWNANSDTEDN
jgi:hypothetical protein